MGAIKKTLAILMRRKDKIVTLRNSATLKQVILKFRCLASDIPNLGTVYRLLLSLTPWLH